MDIIKTGLKSLDNILNGGLPANRSYLIRGGPGTGKTTLGLHFLTEGLKNGESLFISLGEPENSLKIDAQKRDFPVGKIKFLDLSPDSNFVKNQENYNIFHAEEVEKSPIIEKIINAIEEIRPKRIFLDSATYLNYLNEDKYQYRKEILSLIKLISEKSSTLLIASKFSTENPDNDLQFVVDGVFNFQIKDQERYFYISKLRGSDYISGKHSMKLKKDGIHIYPNFISIEKSFLNNDKVLGSGIPSLDRLLNGGIEKGTTTIISGPTGVGKTTLGVQYMKEAAGRGERSVIYTFEEMPESIISRCESINMPINDMIKNSFLEIIKVNPLKYTPDEFFYHLRNKVKEDNIDILLLDSLAGYKMAFPENSSDNDKIRHLHTLSQYLSSKGVTVIIVNEVANIIGDFHATGFGISYLADNIIILNYFEYKSRLKKTIGVLKKRQSDFERYLREFKMNKYGIEIGEPLLNLQGILNGNIKNTLEGDTDA